MKRFATPLLLAALILVPLLASADAFAVETAMRPAEWKAIRNVISAQLKAIQREDAAAAFALTAPSIRSRFRNAGEFMRMARAGYSGVNRPRSKRFLAPFMVSGQPVQPMEFTKDDHAIVIAYYVMEQQPDGTWKIAGGPLLASYRAEV
jgi:hypothetical protein